MGRGRKPKVNWGELGEIVDGARVQLLTEAEHLKLKSTLLALENLLTPEERSSEAAKKLLAQASKSADPKQKRPGGGRNGSDQHKGATIIPVAHGALQHGDCCPDCNCGKVYAGKNPGVLWRFEAQPFCVVKKYELQRLKCNHCDAHFTAAPPAEVGEEKYDETVAAMLGLSRYGAGLPAHRLEGLLKQFGVLLPDSTQWELVCHAANLMQPMADELIRQGANSFRIYTDDTFMRIIDQVRRLKGRTGTYTTAMVAESVQGNKVALFFTGEQHAGENLAEVLRHRAEHLPKPILMCDALSRNRPKEQAGLIEIVMSNCLSHGRRNFVEIYEKFPEECGHLIAELGRVYRNEAAAKSLNLGPDERLVYHQQHSQPVMEELFRWSHQLLTEKVAEPNSGLGKAITYLHNHWKGLTEFLRTPGAALDNNICERAIKKMVLYRKNSMFYRNENGSSVGDVYMSLIHTCELNGVSAFQYLVALQKNAAEVRNNPQDWLPWTFRDRTASATGPPASEALLTACA